MASKDKDVETKVVQMEFDNRQFNKDVEDTTNKVEKLDESVRMKGADKDVNKVTKGFSALKVMATTALATISVKITNSVMGIVKQASGLQNAVAGWSRYEESLTTIGGIINNISSDFESVEDAAKAASEAMEELQWYTDETSFSFETLSQGIQQFTTAGIDISTATSAAMGVTGLAGSSKVFDANKIQSAMNAVAKAMQAGYMDLHKWITLTQTSGVVTKEFAQSLMDAAVAEGKLIKSAAGQYKTKEGKLVTTSNIGTTLSSKWMNNNVLNKALSDYSVVAEEINSIYNDIVNGTASQEVIDKISKANNGKEISQFNIAAKDIYDALDDLGYAFTDVQKKAFLSSQETTTFGQAITAVADAAKTKWQNIYQSIFGDSEEAAELWGELYSVLAEFNTPLNKIADIFTKWNDIEAVEGEITGGAQDFRDAIVEIGEIFVNIFEAVVKAFDQIFGEFDITTITDATKALKKFADTYADEDYINSEDSIYKKVTNFFKIFFSIVKSALKVLKIVKTVISAIWSVIGAIIDDLTPAITNLAGYVSDLITSFADWFDTITSNVDTVKVFETVFNSIIGAFEWFKELLKITWNSIVAWFESFKETKVYAWIKDKIDWLKDLFTDASTFFQKAWAKIKEIWDIIYAKLEEWGIIDWLKTFGETIKKYWIDTIKPKYFTDLATTIKNLINLAGKILLFVTIIKMIRMLNIGSYLRDLSWSLEKLATAATVKNYAVVIVALAGAILAIIYAAHLLADVDAKSLWTVAAVVGILVAVFTAMVILITKLANIKVEKGEKSKPFTRYIGLMIGLGGLALVVAKIAEMMTTVPAHAVIKAMAIITLCAGLMIAISYFGKIGAKTIDKNGVKTTTKTRFSLLSYLALIMVIWTIVIAIAALSIIDTSKIDKVLFGMIGGFILILAIVKAVETGLNKEGKQAVNGITKATLTSIALFGSIILFTFLYGMLVKSLKDYCEEVAFKEIIEAIIVVFLEMATIILVLSGLILSITLILKNLAPDVISEIGKTILYLAIMVVAFSLLTAVSTQIIYACRKYGELEVAAALLILVEVAASVTVALVLVALGFKLFDKILEAVKIDFGETIKLTWQFFALIGLVCVAVVGIVLLTRYLIATLKEWEVTLDEVVNVLFALILITVVVTAYLWLSAKALSLLKISEDVVTIKIQGAITPLILIAGLMALAALALYICHQRGIDVSELIIQNKEILIAVGIYLLGLLVAIGFVGKAMQKTTGSIIGLAINLLIIIAAIFLMYEEIKINGFDWGSFAITMGVLILILFIFSKFIEDLTDNMWSLKGTDAKIMNKFIAILSILTGLIIAIGIIIAVLANVPVGGLALAGTVMTVITAVVFGAIILLLKTLNKNTEAFKNLNFKFITIIGEVAAMILAISIVVAVLADKDPASIKSAGQTMAVLVASVFGGIILLILSLKTISKKVGNGAISKTSLILIAEVAVIVMVLAGFVILLSSLGIDPDSSAYYLITIGVFLAEMLIFIGILLAIVKKADAAALTKASLVMSMMAIIIVALAAVIAAMALALSTGVDAIELAGALAIILVALLVFVGVIIVIANVAPAAAIAVGIIVVIGVALMALAATLLAFSKVIDSLSNFVDKIIELFNILIKAGDGLKNLADGIDYFNNTVTVYDMIEFAAKMLSFQEAIDNIKDISPLYNLSAAIKSIDYSKFKNLIDCLSFFSKLSTAESFESLPGFSKGIERLAEAINKYDFKLNIEVSAINLEPLKQQLQQIVDEISDSIQRSLFSMMNAMGAEIDVEGDLTTSWENAGDWFSQMKTTIADGVKEGLTSWWTSIKNGVNDITTTVQGWGENENVVAAKSAIENAASSVWDWLSTTASSGAAAVGQIFNITNNFDVNEDTEYETELKYTKAIRDASKVNLTKAAD